MSVTIDDVVGLPELQGGAPEVLSRCRWSDSIRWVHVGDVADLSGLLQGGELVLTTGAPLANSPETYLKSVSEAGAVGVIVELGSSLPELPVTVADLAKSYNLALVVLHRTVRFVDVTEAVHRRIVAEQYEVVAFDRLVHETFTELSMQRASVNGIVEAASRMLNEPVVLEDLSHLVLAASATSGSSAASLLRDWERRSRSSPGDRRESEDWTTTTVGPRGEAWGRLIVPGVPEHRARANTVLERAAVALALHRMIERDRTGLHQKAQSGLIDDVLERRITDEVEVAARAHALGMLQAHSYIPLAVRFSAQPDEDPVAIQRRNVQVLDAVSHSVRALGHTGLFATRRDGEVGAVVAVKPTQAGKLDAALSAIGTSIRGALLRLDDACTSVTAVGESDSNISDAIRNLREAAHVAEVASAMKGSTRPFYRAADVRLRGLVALLKDDPRVQTFAETELRSLMSLDASDLLAQLEVLRAYLRHSGNKAAVAHALHLSRPALYKRLDTLQRLLGVDLSDSDATLSLHVALLVYDAQVRSRTQRVGPGFAS